MLLLRTERLPEGPNWLYELKLDGFRALALESGGRVQLRSRNDNDLNARYPGLVKGINADETVIDGEIVALGGDGRPSFNALQNRGEPLHFFIFDLLILHGRNVMAHSSEQLKVPRRVSTSEAARRARRGRSKNLRKDPMQSGAWIAPIMDSSNCAQG